MGATYSGADIEQVVITGLKLAFHAVCELSTKFLHAAVPEVRPLSQTDPERVAAITGWIAGHAKGADRSDGRVAAIWSHDSTRTPTTVI